MPILTPEEHEVFTLSVGGLAITVGRDDITLEQGDQIITLSTYREMNLLRRAMQDLLDRRNRAPVPPVEAGKDGGDAHA